MAKKNEGFEIPSTYLIAIVAVLFVAAAIYFFTQNNVAYGGELTLGNRSISNYEGNFKLMNAQRIALVMDSRGLAQDNKVSVYQCGVGFAASLGIIGKNVTSFALQEDGCYGPLNHTSITKCDELIKQEDYVVLLKGGNADALFYDDHLLVIVPANNTNECGVKLNN
jgi:hypothetical protein